MQVGVADTAEGDVDVNVVRPRNAARDGQRLERLVLARGAISFDVHRTGFPFLSWGAMRTDRAVGEAVPAGVPENTGPDRSRVGR
jgi:hypothetical protein